jgi:hypothetical protein
LLSKRYPISGGKTIIEIYKQILIVPVDEVEITIQKMIIQKGSNSDLLNYSLQRIFLVINCWFKVRYLQFI